MCSVLHVLVLSHVQCIYVVCSTMYCGMLCHVVQCNVFTVQCATAYKLCYVLCIVYSVMCDVQCVMCVQLCYVQCCAMCHVMWYMLCHVVQCTATRVDCSVWPPAARTTAAVRTIGALLLLCRLETYHNNDSSNSCM